MSMEKIVRPFQLPSVTPPRRVIEAEKPVKNATLSIGKKGSGQTFSYNLFFFTAFDVKPGENNIHTEVSRRETIRRVENPDDSEQHVDVKVLEEVKLRKGTNDYNTYKFKNPID